MTIPVHLVLGAPASGKSALIIRLLDARENWIGFANGAGGANARLHALPRGCPCCTGRVEMQVVLARALRRIRAERVLIEATRLTASRPIAINR